MCSAHVHRLLKACAHPAHHTPRFFPWWRHHKWTFLGDVPTLVPPSARNQMKTRRHEIRNWKCDKSGIRNQEWEMWQILEKCWCVACGRRRRLFHSGALLTKPLSLEECPGHAEARLPLKANVHRLRLELGLYFDLHLEDYKTALSPSIKHQIRSSCLYIWTCKRCRFNYSD